MNERAEVEPQAAGFKIRRADNPDDPNNWGEAPDIVSACALMAALYQRTGFPLEVVGEIGSPVAWIGR
jgi:hypothetical protein